MLKAYAEPKRCRSIMAQEGATQTMSTQTTIYPICEDRRSIDKEVTKHATDSVLKDTSKQQVEANKPSKIPLFSKATKKETKDITLYNLFHKHWIQERVLGEGGDGIVYLYQSRKQQSKCIAVKIPRNNSISARNGLVQEVKNLCLLEPHDHILDMCHATGGWWPCGPAIFLPVCELGDLISYRESWCAQQASERKPKHVSEVTIWKLFRDMALALNYIHHELGSGIRYVHNDFKPANILVVTPPGHTEHETLPEEPIFKLSDFARLTTWPTPTGQRAQGFDGTPEYAPPKLEQIAPVQPSADIWGLGATLQFMALGIHPIQSQEAFVLERKAQAKPYPDLEDKREWMSEYWRQRIPTVFRPIHVAKAVLCKEHDLHVPIDYQPYSARLGYWYAQLWKPIAYRPKASKLASLAIPHMDDQIERIKKLRQTRKKISD
ncbi:ATP binding [Ascochyta rabiei]|uniref:ATP binding n=1 Tax=Didymella rabiei TaxID=5454 RepID=A0A163A261_DIDRA|nr:ATP binding [Ascochyta rabiei]